MKKLLLLTIALFTLSGAWADYQKLYVIGDGTTKGWDRTAMDQMTYNSSTQTYTYEYTPTAAENWFAIADYQQSAEEAAEDPYWVNFRTHRYYISEGTDFVPELGTEYSMITGDGSIKLPKGTYTISVKDMKITVTGTVTPVAETWTVAGTPACKLGPCKYQ